MKQRFIALGLSCVFLMFGLGSIGILGINLGLDFTGGVLVEIGFSEDVEIDEVRNHLETNGYENLIIQSFGSERDVSVRVPPVAGIDQSGIGNEIQTALADVYPGVDLRKSEFVGPAVGEELTEKGGLAILVALLIVMIYIMFRFTGKFAIGAVIALIHDILIVIGIFSFLQFTFNLQELAAVLAVLGYSLNDTIVVSDRIRENFRTVRRMKPIDTINRSLNQTLGRTVVTSLTTLLVLFALLFFGGEQIFGFALVLTIGVVVGTYSSIYVAASTLMFMNLTSDDLAVVEKENAGQGV